MRFHQPKGFADFAGGVRVALGGTEIAQEEVDAGELAPRVSFGGSVVEVLRDSKAFLHGTARFVEVAPGGGLVSARTGAFTLHLTDDADALRRLADPYLILHLYRQLAGFFKPGSRRGGAAGGPFGHPKEAVGSHHCPRIACILETPE